MSSHCNREQLLSELLPRWGASPAGAHELGGTRNLVHCFAVQGRPLVLRISPDEHRKAGEIAAELDWVHRLAARGLKVCAPVASCSGSLLESIALDERTYHAAVFQEAPGRYVRRAELNRAHMLKLGGLLARLHLDVIDDPVATRQMRWDRELPGLLKVAQQDPEARDALEQSTAHLRALPCDRENFGLIHSDLHMHNYHVHEDVIWLFDFDNCEQNWFASDIACTWYFALAWTAGEDLAIWHQMRQPIIAALLDGYRRTRRVNDEMLEQIPLFFRHRALALYAYLTHRYGPKPNPQHRAKLATARANAFADTVRLVADAT